MARIVVGAYMVRYPLGGMLSLAVQLVAGLRRLGHEVTVVEKAGWEGSCFDPVAGAMSDDCAYGTAVVRSLLAEYGLGDRWCFVDAGGACHGLPAGELRAALDGCDAFLDAGTHGHWLEDLPAGRPRVLLDGEPGWTQMRWMQRSAAGEPLPDYDVHLTVGQNVGTTRSAIPTVGRRWGHTFYPVLCDEFTPVPPRPGASYTTVMNWQAHDTLEFGGHTYGQKDMEFERFVDLPRLAEPASLEIAIAGSGVPRERLTRAGWGLRDAHATTHSYDGYRAFIGGSRGEFSVAKNVFVATNSGWFSDRSAAYLASGRPVVVQDTGISGHLPCGEGLFAVADAEGAAAAIEEIEQDYGRHAAAARAIALEYLAAERVLPAILGEVGL